MRTRALQEEVAGGSEGGLSSPTGILGLARLGSPLKGRIALLTLARSLLQIYFKLKLSHAEQTP